MGEFGTLVPDPSEMTRGGKAERPEEAQNGPTHFPFGFFGPNIGRNNRATT